MRTLSESSQDSIAETVARSVVRVLQEHLDEADAWARAAWSARRRLPSAEWMHERLAAKAEDAAIMARTVPPGWESWEVAA